MSPSEQLVALYEFLGWTEIRSGNFDDFYGYNPISREREELPALSLDLMAEAESKLTAKQRDDYYYTHLHKKDEDHSWTVSASKEERLEALLKTIGKM